MLLTVIVAMSACAFVDASALAVLLDLHRRMSRGGGVLTLRGSCPRVLRLLSLTGLRRVFDHFLTLTGEFAPDEIAALLLDHVRQRHGDDARLIGFSTHTGTVTALEPSSAAFIEKASGIKSRYVMEKTGILDRRDRWAAHDTRLVQLGDILGRGGEPGKIFRLLKRLEQEAPAYGSSVHVLLGNHEAMVLRVCPEVTSGPPSRY